MSNRASQARMGHILALPAVLLTHFWRQLQPEFGKDCVAICPAEPLLPAASRLPSLLQINYYDLISACGTTKRQDEALPFWLKLEPSGVPCPTKARLALKSHPAVHEQQGQSGRDWPYPCFASGPADTLLATASARVLKDCFASCPAEAHRW